MRTMGIVGHRVEGARRRIPFQALFAEARAPQGSGPFCFAFFWFSVPAVIVPQAVNALSQLAQGPGWTWHRRSDPACGSDNNHFGCAFAPPPEDSSVDGLAGCAGDSDPPVQRCRRGARMPRVAHRARAQPKWRALFFSSSRPGDGTGIRVRLRSGTLGVRLSPGAPIICWVYCQSGRRPALDAGGCRFKSCHPDQHFCSANSVARVPPCQDLFTLISGIALPGLGAECKAPVHSKVCTLQARATPDGPRPGNPQAPGSQGFDPPAERHPFFPR